jgi:hypothetical protein
MGLIYFTPEVLKVRNIHVCFSSVSDQWTTPRELYKTLDDEFHFDFEACTMGGTDKDLTTPSTSWTGKRAFVICQSSGPGIAEWLEKGLQADIAVFLIPALSDTRWFYANVCPKAKEVRFIRGRQHFGNAVNGAPCPSMILIFGKRELSI